VLSKDTIHAILAWRNDDEGKESRSGGTVAQCKGIFTEQGTSCTSRMIEAGSRTRGTGRFGSAFHVGDDRSLQTELIFWAGVLADFFIGLFLSIT
jgi:hypothetical protein